MGRAALPFCLHYLSCHTAATASMASPTILTFDAEGRAVDFDVWVDDLQLFLQCDSRDGVSLFDHTSGVSTTPAATADCMVCSQWTTRDAVARLAVRSHLPPAERAHFGQYNTAQSLYDAVVARYSSPATAALSRLMLPYHFPNLAAFATVADLIAHLRTSDARYRAALPTEDHVLSLCPTELTVDLLEEHLAAAEKSILAVGASRDDRRTPTCIPCVEGRQRAAPHSSTFPLTEAPLQTLHMDVKGEVRVDWIRGARFQLSERFGSDLFVLCLHSDRGGEFSSNLLRAFCRAEGIRQRFTLPASRQENGIAECCIGMVMDVARMSMIHAAAPHFLWPFAVQYTVHQINLQPRVSLPKTTPTLRWTEKVGDASTFRVWGSRDFVHDTSADKLSSRAVPCVFLGFPPDAPRWQFYHPTSRRVLSSHDVTFDESVSYYSLFPYRTASLPPPPPLFLALGTPPPVEVAVDSGVARGAEPAGAGTGDAEPRDAEPRRVESGGAEPAGAEPGGAEPKRVESGGAEPEHVEPGVAKPGGTASWGAEPACAESGGSPGVPLRREPLSPQRLREWYARRCRCGAGAGAAGGAAGAGAVGGATRAGAAGATGSGGARTGGTGAAGAGGAVGVGAEGTRAAGAGATGGAAGAGAAGGAAGAGAARGAAGDGAAGGAAGAGAAGAARPGGARTGGNGAAGTGGVAGGGARGTGAGGAAGAVTRDPGAEGTGAVSAVSGGAPRPRPYYVPLLQQPASPLPGPSPYSGPTRGRMERRELELRPVSPESHPASLESHSESPVRTVRAGRRVSCLRPPPVPGTHSMTLHPSTAPQRVPLLSPPASSLPDGPNPESDSLRAASPTVTRFLATAVTDPLFESTAASALVAELVDFAVACCLDFATSLVAESASASVKRPPGSPPVFKARFDARGFSQRQGVDFFQTFSPTPKMTTLRVLLHVAAQRDYELRSLDFSTAFLQGSRHEEIWLRRPPGFTGSFPAGTQWSLRRPVYGLRQAPHDLVFATADTEALAHMNSELQKKHTCTDLGVLTRNLGLRITRDRAQRTITLTQSHMVQQVLQRFGFTYSSPQSTSLPTGHSLSAPPSDKSVESSGPYPELVGCLMYLMTCTRPDLAYPLSLLARYVAPGRHRKVHWDAAKRVLRYLCSTLGMGLMLGGRARVVLTGHADASWVDDLDTQRSSQGYTFSLGSSSVPWRSTRSSSVLSSICEAEIYVGAMAAQELRWLTYLLTDLGEAPRSPPVLYVDNKAMLALCQEYRLEHRTKHIALRYFLTRELQQRGQLCFAYVASQANTADVFTKALQPCDHQRFCTVLGLVPTVPHLLTS
ncbi:unnamed protein product [Closterium sp. NIES-54]